MLYNIGLSQSFLRVFCNKLLSENKNNRENLYNYIILVPNKRIIRNLQTTFLQCSKADSLILPRMISIFDLDYLVFSQSQKLKKLQGNDFNNILKPTISANERAYILVKIITKMHTSLNFNKAFDMAILLGKLIDRSYMENVDFRNIEKIIDHDLAMHWQNILKFLSIATHMWPQYLEENNLVDTLQRQQLIYKFQAQFWSKYGDSNHIIALNILDYNHNIINLLKVVHNLKNSDLYFCGIDYSQNEDEFKKVEESSPQKIISYTLSKMNITRNQIIDLCEDKEKETVFHKVFDKVINKDIQHNHVKHFVDRFSFINTPNVEEEARTIALVLRETLETKEKSAGLVTNNKDLIERVKNELREWNIEIDNYLGESLYQSPQAKLFLLTANIIENSFNPKDFLSLLNHPLCYMKLNKQEIKLIAQYLDFYLFRNIMVTYDISSYQNEVKKMSFLPKEIQKKLISFFKHLESLLYDTFPIIKKAKNSKLINFKDTLIAHIKIAEKISSQKHSNQSELWVNQEGGELSTLLFNLLIECDHIQKISIHEYVKLLKKTIQNTNIRTIYNKHARLYIYGNIQSNMIHHDTIIIADMNEGSIPLPSTYNPWINQNIMNKLGFISNEAKMGITAGIFAQLLGANEVVITRSEKDQQGRFTTPSRWLLKLNTFIDYYKSYKLSLSDFNDKNYLYHIQKELIKPKKFTPLNLNNIKYNVPPLHRPRKISATQFESLIKNPYIYFIDNILKIKPLNTLNPKPIKKDYGVYLHKILEIFIKNINSFQELSFYQKYHELIKMADKYFQPFLLSPTFKLFKMPVIKHALHEFLKQEKWNDIKQSYVEISGSINLHVDNVKIDLNAKADRVDITPEGNVHITDYKTTSRKNNKIKIENYHKQLLILSFILYKGGFWGNGNLTQFTIKNIEANYLFLPNKLSELLEIKNNGIDKIIDNMLLIEEEIIQLINKYYIQNDPYEFNLLDSLVYDDHKHFIRFEEWNTNLSLNSTNNSSD